MKLVTLMFRVCVMFECVLKRKSGLNVCGCEYTQGSVATMQFLLATKIVVLERLSDRSHFVSRSKSAR